jgi:hypothetical protein
MFGINNCDEDGLEDVLSYYNINSTLDFSQQYFDPDELDDEGEDE